MVYTDWPDFQRDMPRNGILRNTKIMAAPMESSWALDIDCTQRTHSLHAQLPEVLSDRETSSAQRASPGHEEGREGKCFLKAVKSLSSRERVQRAGGDFEES